ncbi:MAG: hypothetical protein R3C19_20710 [Planctomycetaceae bacterium]
MIRNLGTILAACAAACLLISVQAAEEKPEAKDKFTAKCPVSGQPAKEAQFTAYKEAKAYFCCEKCKAAFEKEPAKHAVKANAQLVQTKQYVQAKCPLSGGKLDKETAIKVGELKVAFCCSKCKGKAEGTEGDEQLALVFSDEAFKKGFEKAKPKEDK